MKAMSIRLGDTAVKAISAIQAHHHGVISANQSIELAVIEYAQSLTKGDTKMTTETTTLLLGDLYIPGYDEMPSDMAAEAVQLDEQRDGQGPIQPYDFYRLVSESEDGNITDGAGKLMWVPSARRAGICVGGDTVWTDAANPDEAVARWNSDDMIN